MTHSTLMKSWPLSVKVGAGIGVAVLVLIVFLRLGQRESEPPATDEVASEHAPLSQSERVQQRLDQLRSSHQAKTRGEMGGGPVDARSGVDAAPKQKMASREHPANQPANAVGDTGEAGADPGTFEDDPDDIPALKELALRDADPERRLAAVTMLGASEDAQVIPILAQALSDQDEEVRMAALQALSDFTDEPPVEAIESALNDSSPDVRFEALDVLSDVGGDRARAAIERMLNDPDEDVRSLAEGILDFEQLYEPTPAEGAPAGSAEPSEQEMK